MAYYFYFLISFRSEIFLYSARDGKKIDGSQKQQSRKVFWGVQPVPLIPGVFLKIISYNHKDTDAGCLHYLTIACNYY
jgi:hypothetical protein